MYAQQRPYQKPISKTAKATMSLQLIVTSVYSVVHAIPCVQTMCSPFMGGERMTEGILMKGNEALAEAAIRAGCNFYVGYPITPQNEVLEYMCWRMEQSGGEFIQSESEIASVNILLGAAAAGARGMISSSGPGFSLFQEGISYLVAGDIPAVIVDVARYGSGIGEISQGQCDYSLVTRGNGHGDSHLIVLTPASVQETADLTALAFDLAEKYRHPVIILSDAAIGQMMEPVVLPEPQKADIDRYDWTVKGCLSENKPRLITNLFYYMDDYDRFLRDKYESMRQNEQRWESFCVDDAEIIIVAYGISSRVSREVVRKARDEGIKLGMIRLITAYPFPEKAFEHLDNCKAFVTVEMSAVGHLADDVRLADRCAHPVYSICTGINVPERDEILTTVKSIADKNAGGR